MRSPTRITVHSALVLIAGLAVTLVLAAPARAATLAGATLARTTSFAPLRGAVLVDATVDGAPTAAAIEILRGGALVATGSAGSALSVLPGDYVVRVTPAGATLGPRSLSVRVEARVTARRAAAWTTGELRVQIYNAGILSTIGLAEVFRAGSDAAIAHTGPGGTLRLETGSYRVRVNRRGDHRWFDVTVTAGGLAGVTAIY